MCELNVLKGKFQVFNEKTKKRPPKTPTKARLKNIALHYLERFETSKDNLRNVLRRRIDKYVFFDKTFNPEQAYVWADEIVEECAYKNYVSDDRYTELKINSYLRAGKPKRYIEQKLKQKGIDEKIIRNLFNETDYNEFDIAYNFAKKKKIGPFRDTENKRQEFYQKDLGTLVRAGFNFDIAKDILDSNKD